MQFSKYTSITITYQQNTVKHYYKKKILKNFNIVSYKKIGNTYIISLNI